MKIFVKFAIVGNSAVLCGLFLGINGAFIGAFVPGLILLINEVAKTIIFNKSQPDAPVIEADPSKKKVKVTFNDKKVEIKKFSQEDPPDQLNAYDEFMQQLPEKYNQQTEQLKELVNKLDLQDKKIDELSQKIEELTLQSCNNPQHLRKKYRILTPGNPAVNL